MTPPQASVYSPSDPPLVEPASHAECVYRTVTLAAILLILASLWAF